MSSSIASFARPLPPEMPNSQALAWRHLGNTPDRADFSDDLHHYLIDGQRMEEGIAIDYLIAQGMGQYGAHQYLRSLIQQLNAKVTKIFASYGIDCPLPVPEDVLAGKLDLVDNPAILTNADIDLLIGEAPLF